MVGEIDEIEAWDDIANSLGIPVKKDTVPCLDHIKMEGFVCTMIGMEYFETDDAFLNAFEQYGPSRADIENRVYGHMRDCEPCRLAHEAARKEYTGLRQSLAPKPQPAPLSERRRDSGTYALVDPRFVEKRKSSPPPRR